MAVGTDQGVIEAFVAAWHATDAEALRTLVRRCWADDAVLTLPSGEHTGRDALVAEIGRTTAAWPENSRVAISAVDEHHGWLRYRWTIAAPDGAIVGQGLHVGERAPDGRLRRIVAFYGPPPSVD